MDAKIQAFKNYVQESLGLQLTLKKWKDKENLPHFLQDPYFFYTASLLGKLCILMVAQEDDVITPAVLHKHIQLLQEKTGLSCIYISSFASSYNRKRLIAHRVQFVITGTQIYLPGLGLDWLESCSVRRKPGMSPKSMSPSTRAVVIYALNHQQEKQFIPLKLAKILNYTPMTMTRALNELESLELGKTVRNGKERLFSFFKAGLSLWSQIKPIMQNPVKKRLWLELNKNSIKKIKPLSAVAGLSAVAEQTMLVQPKIPICAISVETWKKLQQSDNFQQLPLSEEADIEVEVWDYDPLLFAKKGIVDSFSLYLSLKGNADERVETALKKIMKEKND